MFHSPLEVKCEMLLPVHDNLEDRAKVDVEIYLHVTFTLETIKPDIMESTAVKNN